MLRWEKWVMKLEKFIIDCNNSTRVESMYNEAVFNPDYNGVHFYEVLKFLPLLSSIISSFLFHEKARGIPWEQ